MLVATPLVDRPRVRPSGLVLAPPQISPRDASILAATAHKLHGTAFDFHDAVRALHESVVQLIPAGRIFLLGTGEQDPIFGSTISGVGITTGPHGVIIVRVTPDGCTLLLGSLQP